MQFKMQFFLIPFYDIPIIIQNFFIEYIKECQKVNNNNNLISKIIWITIFKKLKCLQFLIKIILNSIPEKIQFETFWILINYKNVC